MLSPEIYDSILDLYSRGENVTQALLSQKIPVDFDVIELLYDLQAGTYTAFALKNENFYKSFSEEISIHLEPFLNAQSSILDCGTGEANTFIPLLKRFPNLSKILAIDSSWSRLSWAKQNLGQARINGFKIAVADMKQIPLEDDSVDVAIAIHAIEPNGGSEQIILNELGRVGRKYIVLVEPDYFTANSQQQLRMNSLNYIGDLRPFFPEAGLRLIKFCALENYTNPLNKSSLFVLEKITSAGEMGCQTEIDWVDPISKTNGQSFGSGLRFHNGLWYPILENIPFLRNRDGKYTHAPAPESS